MYAFFFNFDHLRITLQISDLIWDTKFCAPSLFLPSLIFSYHQALIHGFLRWWASFGLIFSLKWHLQSSFSFSIMLSLNFKNQSTPLMKKIQGLQAPRGATSCGIKSIFHIQFKSLFFILFSMYILHYIVVWCCLE